MNLNLTQRQTCELIRRLHEQGTALSEKWLAIMSQLFDVTSTDELITTNLKDMQQLGLIGENLALHEVQLFDDAISQTGGIITNPIRVYFDNVSWIQSREWRNFKSSFPNLGVTSTLMSELGQPIMDRVTSAGHATIVDYLKSKFDYGSTSFKGDLVVEYLGVQHVLYQVSMPTSDTVLFEGLPDLGDTEFLDTIMTCMSYVAAMNAMMRDIAGVLTNNICTPADLMATLSKYANSEWSNIREIANSIIGSGSDSVLTALNTFIATYRNMHNYTENDDGSLTWNTSGHVINASCWAIIGQVVSSAASVLGTVLMYSLGVVGMIAGGAIMVLGSIISSINTAVGQLTGQTPVVWDEAIDDTYADPIFQGSERIKISWFRNAEDTLRNLETNGRSKLVLPWAIIYMYNYKPQGDYANIDYKVFARMNGTDLHYLVRYRYALLHQQITPLDGWHFKTYCWSGMTGVYDWFAAKCSETKAQTLEVNSMNPSNWKNFYYSILSTSLMTILSVLCSPVYRRSGSWYQVTNNDVKYGSSIKTLLGEARHVLEHDSLNDTDDIANAIGALSNVSHGDENILAACLSIVNMCDVSTPTEFEAVYGASQCVIQNDVIADCTDQAFLNSGYPSFGYWDDEYCFTLPFIGVDRCSFATPPAHSYKSILWATIIGAAVVTGLTVATVISSKIIKKKISEKRFLKGSELMREGEFYRDPDVQQQYTHMSPAEKAEFDASYKKYVKKVNRFNRISNFLGCSSLDWQNNWWNAYDNGGAVAALGDSGSSFQDFLNTEAGQTVTTAGVTAVTTRLGVTDRLVESSIDDVLRVITGVSPQMNR